MTMKMKQPSRTSDSENQDNDNSEACSVEDTSSLGETQTVRGSSLDTEAADDSPLALIRKDNKAVSRARALVVLLLLFATLSTSYFVYFFTRESEGEAFEIEFAAIADRILESFLADTGLRMSQASTVAAGVTLAMRAYGTVLHNLTIDEKDWEKLTNELVTIGKSPLIAYSPYLKTDEERRLFEDHAAKSSGNSTAKNPPCYLCGKGVDVLNPENNFEIPGAGTYKCSDVHLAGVAGAIPPAFCEFTKTVFSSACTCNPHVIPEEEQGPDEDTQSWPIQDGIFRMEGLNDTRQDFGFPPYAPLWQAVAPVVRSPPNLYDQMSEPSRQEAIRQCVEQSTVVFSKMQDRRQDPFYTKYVGLADRTSVTLYFPIWEPESPDPTGAATVDISVENYFTTLFPSNSHMIDIVLENSCGQAVTTKPSIEGRSMAIIGQEDLHDTTYDSLSRSTSFEEYEAYVATNARESDGTLQDEAMDFCRYRLHVYPTREFEDFHRTNKPFVYAAITAFVFLFTTLVFALYDIRVRMRQEKIMESAMRTNNIVASLFPQNVRDRLYEQVGGRRAVSAGAKSKATRLEKFLEDKNGADGETAIADLFTHCTIAFIDIAGFTAWSSERDPQQVFRLLEALYGSFDEVARALDVFKVETIGDSYVAVCGLPTAKPDHAVIMVRFADQCLRRMARVTHGLERFLGPSTGDLEARVGLHSGPVTAGILRSEKARFQLFGDSMNFAARMESSGIPNLIHVSPACANELSLQGKGHWLTKRPDVVHLKGKGQIQTFWAVPRSNKGTSSASSGSGLTGSSHRQSRSYHKGSESERVERLIDWNVEVLLQHLQPVVNSRANKPRPSNSSLSAVREAEQQILLNQGIVVDEMTEILDMPDFDPETAVATSQDVAISPRVKEQLKMFVVHIASTYRNNAFHNFDHASHVVLSTGKLMKRILSPDHIDYDQNDIVSIAREIHSSTYGISSDPLLLFTAVFSALIHDVDHTGLTNAELIQMKTLASLTYRERSVAEQNSVEVAWGMLMSDQFTDLRNCIYSNEQELNRFRQLLVNATMATDIADKEFQQLRKNRWRDAFEGGDAYLPEQDKVENCRKATIIFEYIIQASDVAHTMQHWHIYVKYNKRLFEERYVAWLQGIAGEKDPSHSWYKGEISFFEFYIIPLARKLDTCRVFGVSYHEYLQYAVGNKAEWEEKGEALVQEMLAECREKYGDGNKAINSTRPNEE